MRFPRLPYEMNGLEPFISKESLELHLREFQSFIQNLKLQVLNTTFGNSDLDTMVKYARGPIHYNAIQVWNHSFYFAALKPGINRMQKGSLSMAINGCFGSFRDFREAFIKYAVAARGEGWIWVVLNREGSLEIIKDSRFSHPLLKDFIPLLNCDLWKHAYIKDYQKNPVQYIDAFLQLVDWDMIEKRYHAALRQIMRKNQVLLEV